MVVSGDEHITGIDFELAPGSSITGTVSDGFTHAGIQDAHVDIYDVSGAWLIWVNTEADGSYMTEAVLPAGTYFATTWNDQGYFNELYDDLDCG